MATAKPHSPPEASDAVEPSAPSAPAAAPAARAAEPSRAIDLPTDPELLAELPTFEQFFKTFGFKRVHGRVWGLLVLSERPLSSREVSETLELSAGATSTTLNELLEWGAVTSSFDSARRCHLHSPVGNALSIAATILRRREQVAFAQFRQTANRALSFIQKRHGERDPRVLTLRSVISACDLAEALMKLLVGAVANALGDPESILSRAVGAAFKVGLGSKTGLLRAGEHGPEGDADEAEADGGASAPTDSPSTGARTAAPTAADAAGEDRP